MINLRPPLENLAERLFSDVQEPEVRAEQLVPESDSTSDESWRDMPVPAAVRSAIASHVAAREFKQPVEVLPGDIILLSRVGNEEKHESRPLTQKVGVLLVEQTGPDIWRGFVVAGEQDYASQFDVFVDAKDEPVDPAMCFVQTWNPVEIVLKAVCRRLGALSAARLAAVAEVAKEAHAGLAPTALPTAISRIGLRQLGSGASVVTGTSIGTLNDPRRQYQSLYRALAREASVPAIALKEKRARQQAETQAVRSWRSWLWPTLAGVAATLLIGQNVLMQAQLNTETQEKTRSIERATSGIDQAGPRLRIQFKPSLRYETFAKALRDMDARVESGPDDNGDIYLLVAPDKIQEAAGLLRTRNLVDSVEIVPAKKDMAK